MSPSLYKFLLTSHLIVSVGWLGIVIAKLVLGLTAAFSADLDTTDALYASTGMLNIAFPPVAIGTVLTGVLLSLGTKWGLLRHYWVVTKIVLTVGVVVTAVQLGDRFVGLSRTASGDPAGGGTGEIAGLGGFLSAPSTLLLSLTVTHLLTLVVATVVSVYKPWGRTWFDRRGRTRRPVPVPRPSHGSAGAVRTEGVEHAATASPPPTAA